MTGKGKTCIAVLAIAIVGTCIFIGNTFFFNPLLFRKSEITYLPWSWYKKPLQIEYFVMTDDGWKSTKSTDIREIKQFFGELHRGLHQPTEMIDGPDRVSVWVAVRRMDDGVVLLAMKGYEDEKQFVVQDNVPVILSEKLQSVLEARLVEARGSTGSSVSR